MRRMVSLMAMGLALATLGADKPPQKEEIKPGSPAIIGTRAADYEGQEPQGCPFVSVSRKEVACWWYDMDMGFGGTELRVYSLGQSKAKAFLLSGRWENEEDYGLKAANVKAAQEYLTKGGFVVAKTRPLEAAKAKGAVRLTDRAATITLGKGTTTVKLPNIYYIDDLGKGVTAKQAKRCCGWSVGAEATDGDMTIFTLQGECRWARMEDEGCSAPEYNEENRRDATIRILVNS